MFRKDGMNLMRQKNYADALNQFWAALTACADKPQDNDMVTLIKEVQQKWVNELEVSVIREKKAYQDALSAKNEAEKAREAEQIARIDAETNAKKAKDQGIRAESLRMALLADLVRQQGRKSESVVLAWLATQLSPHELTPFALHTFGNAVLDSFSNTLFTFNEKITDLQALPDSNQLLVKTNSTNWFLITRSKTAPATATKLPTSIIGLNPASNGQYFVAWTTNSDVLVLDHAGTVVTTLKGHTEPARFGLFSADNQRMLTGGRDNTARIWDQKGNLLFTLQGHTGNVYAAEFSPNSQLILTKASDGTARIWNSKGELCGVLKSDQRYIGFARFGANNRIVTLDSKGIAAISDEKGNLLFKSEGTQPIKQIELLQNEAILSRSFNSTIEIFSLEGKQINKIITPSVVLGMCMKGQLLFTWGNDHIIQSWDINGKQLANAKGHISEIKSVNSTVDQRHLVSLDNDGNVKIWNSKGQQLSDLPNQTVHSGTSCFSSNGKEILYISQDQKSILSAPLPMDVLQHIGKLILDGDEINYIAKKYNIQFYDILKGNISN
jgi:WD40 repeat protein